MKKRALVLAALVPALALSACAATSPQDAYVSAVQADAPGVLDRGSRDELLTLGQTICDGLDGGTSAYELADGFTGIGWTVAEAGTVVVQAATHLCPENLDAVR